MLMTIVGQRHIDSEFSYPNQYGKWWDFYFPLLQVAFDPKDIPYPTEDVRHLFQRGGTNTKCGDGELFHARVHTNGAEFCTEPSVVAEATRIMNVARVIPGRKAYVVQAGSTEWLHELTGGWYQAYYHMGNALVTMQYWSSTYLRVSYNEDYRMDAKGNLSCKFAMKDCYLYRNDYHDHPASFWWNVVKSDVLANGLRLETVHFTGPKFGYLPVPVLAQFQNFDFASGMLELYQTVTDLGYVSDHNTARFLSDAYVRAFENLPETSCNTIANAIEGIAALASLRRGKVSKLESIGDAWLKYRYVYNTTKTDFNDYRDLTDRLVTLAQLSTETIKTYGTVINGAITYKCVIEYTLASILPQDSADWLTKYGVKLSLYNAWDMVPYSFVVDWFLHIGDLLEAFETYGDALQLQPVSVWYSISSYVQTDSGYGDVYIRLRGSGIPSALPHFSYKETSGKTLLMRITDALALFLE